MPWCTMGSPFQDLNTAMFVSFQQPGREDPFARVN